MPVLLPNMALAANVIKSFVDQQGEHYLIDLSMQLDAPKSRVMEVMTNYNHLTELSETITESTVLEQTQNHTKLKMVSEGCVLFICQSITQVQNIKQLEDDYIAINVEPMADNIKFSAQLWHFKSLGPNSTQVNYSADIVPDFWIPPLIGSWVFQSRLLEEATLMINKAEQLANNSPVIEAQNEATEEE